MSDLAPSWLLVNKWTSDNPPWDGTSNNSFLDMLYVSYVDPQFWQHSEERDVNEVSRRSASIKSTSDGFVTVVLMVRLSCTSHGHLLMLITLALTFPIPCLQLLDSFSLALLCVHSQDAKLLRWDYSIYPCGAKLLSHNLLGMFSHLNIRGMCCMKQ